MLIFVSSAAAKIFKLIPTRSNFELNQNLKNLTFAKFIAHPVQLNSNTDIRRSFHIDRSKVPKIVEDELEERFVRGSGPGGQNVNKTANCVVLKHLPTGCSHFGCSYNLIKNYATILSRNIHVDRSNVPKLKEDEIEEQFVRGSGPGGSNVNKTANCVVLKHLPTGLVVKCHESRLLDKNRQLAREKLVTKLDNHFNGDLSVEAQIKSATAKEKQKRDAKSKRHRELKEKYKNLMEENN